MRRYIALALTALSCLIALPTITFPASAQQYPNGLSADSVDPATDEVFINAMKRRLEQIRRTEHRPTVALVLSGGGAKGSSHVGVLKVLEEMEIPIDLICGTSMGGLIGGLYSMGYPAEMLDSLLRVQDWEVTLTDKVDPKYISLASKEYKSKYLLSVPFHYEKEKAATKKKNGEVRYRNRQKNLSVDAEAGDLNTQAGVNNLASSLPSGYVYGFNVNNLISSLTIGYHDDMSFTDLPIPFFAVSADMVSCKAKNWGSGSVKHAMRSTMSIPGLFDPIWTDGMVLVDGGTRNNFPVDIARAMGADYVIGVELSDAAPEYSEVNNLGDILMQFIKMLGQDAFDKNRPDVDVFIKPRLDGYNMLSFNEVAIDTMIHRGYAAAMEHKDELMSIKRVMNGAKPRLNHPRAVDISQQPVSVSSVGFEGVSDAESKMLMRKIKKDIGSTVGKDNIDVAMQKLQATNAFETVTYSLYGDTEPYRLVFNGEKGPVHKVGVGIRMDTQEWVSALLNLSLNANKLKGSKLEFEACLNKNFYTDLHYSLDLPFLPTVNAFAEYFKTGADYYKSSGGGFYSTEFHGNKVAFYLSNIKWTEFDMNLGVQNTDFTTTKMLSNGNTLSSESKSKDFGSSMDGNAVSAFVKANIYTLDDKYFPKKGMTLELNGDWFLYYPSKTTDFLEWPTVSLDYSQVSALGSHAHLLFDLHSRFLLDETPLEYFNNYIGGALAGRYWDHQIPFIGTNRIYCADRKVVAANMELRANLAKSLYLSALAGGFVTSDTLLDTLEGNSVSSFGFGAQLSYNTIAGPIKARASWSSMFKEVEYYLSIGFDF